MKRLLIAANLLAALVVIVWGADRYIAPMIAVAVYGDEYKEMMFQCDHVMREHFIAKQLVLAAPTEETIRNLEAAEIGLTTCHDYDKLRKKMIGWGVKENELASLGLEAIEKRATDVRKFVEIHEIRY
ncbi:MAG: hypothetical protein IIA72_13470 [Proteobacteria bacterium]|jgi:hypothetical protein|nr:hypothetical protein [Pseudomonadota bacterium]